MLGKFSLWAQPSQLLSTPNNFLSRTFITGHPFLLFLGLKRRFCSLPVFVFPVVNKRNSASQNNSSFSSIFIYLCKDCMVRHVEVINSSATRNMSKLSVFRLPFKTSDNIWQIYFSSFKQMFSAYDNNREIWNTNIRLFVEFIALVDFAKPLYNWLLSFVSLLQ
jgi:hypothetical protein